MPEVGKPVAVVINTVAKDLVRFAGQTGNAR